MPNNLGTDSLLPWTATPNDVESTTALGYAYERTRLPAGDGDPEAAPFPFITTGTAGYFCRVPGGV